MTPPIGGHMLATLLGLFGATCIVFGLVLIYPPLALIVGGAILVRAATLIEPRKESA